MSRLETLKKTLMHEGFDAAVIMPGTNLFYLTSLNMHTSERVTIAVIPVSGEPFVVAPLLEAEKVRRITGWPTVYGWADEEGPFHAIEKSFNEHGLKGKNLACEYLLMRLLEYTQIKRALNQDVVIGNADPILEGMRSSKDADEVALMEKAVICVEEALAAAQKMMKPGVRENEVSQLISDTIAAHGGVGGGSVISGERGCLPHAITSDKPLEDGDFVIIDTVARYQGYAADITRTFAIGTPNEELKKIYDIVYAAQKHCRENAKPGMTGEEIDALCRDYITAAGYGEYFIHRTGHGLGLEVHEAPYVVKGNTRPFTVGTTFTIEPGIYVPGLGGVRIEDDAFLVEGGMRSLTNFPRELIVLP